MEHVWYVRDDESVKILHRQNTRLSGKLYTGFTYTLIILYVDNMIWTTYLD